MTTIAERVAAGAAFLDEHDPGWWRPDVDRAIDLDALELADPALCILGQRCPLEVLNSHYTHPRPEDRYWAYADALRLSDGSHVLDWAAPLGFATYDLSEYPSLTDGWAQIIEARRAAP